MSGPNGQLRPNDRHWWSTRQQLVVISGEPALVTQWFEITHELHESVRDVIDGWDEIVAQLDADDDACVRLDQFAERMATMRTLLHAVRQWDVDR